MDFFTRISSKNNPFEKQRILRDEDRSGARSLPIDDESEELIQDTSQDLPVDVYNTPEKIMIIAQLASVDQDDLYITVKDEVLTISGVRQKPVEIEDVDQRYIHTEECSWGTFRRPIILPQTVDIRKIKARFTKDKVLILTIPKTNAERESVVKIEIVE